MEAIGELPVELLAFLPEGKQLANLAVRGIVMWNGILPEGEVHDGI